MSMPATLKLPEEWLQDEPELDLTHRSVLERNARKATDLPITMLSAKNTTHHEPLVFVLLRHDGEPHLVLYNVSSQKLMTATVDDTFKLLQCDVSEQKAIIRPQIVERAALDAVKAWCQEHQANPTDCDHLCVIYLNPRSNQEQDLKDMLTSKAKLGI